jgi:uridine phosphorylase
VAQRLLEKPLMFNHHRGLWGYTGTARDGAPLTVQATGMGGPSAAIVVEELIGLGARMLVRIGTCGSLRADIGLATFLAIDTAIAADGASHALGAEGGVAADAELAAALADAAGQPPATCVSTDLFYDAREELMKGWAADGAAVVEMEAAAVMQVASNHGVRAGCLLAVTDELARGRVRAGFEEIEELGLELGEKAWAALERLSG